MALTTLQLIYEMDRGWPRAKLMKFFCTEMSTKPEVRMHPLIKLPRLVLYMHMLLTILDYCLKRLRTSSQHHSV